MLRGSRVFRLQELARESRTVAVPNGAQGQVAAVGGRGRLGLRGAESGAVGGSRTEPAFDNLLQQPRGTRRTRVGLVVNWGQDRGRLRSEVA